MSRTHCETKHSPEKALEITNKVKALREGFAKELSSSKEHNPQVLERLNSISKSAQI